MKNVTMLIINFLIICIFMLNISVLLVGYGFEGKSIYIFMVIIFLYSIYTVFFRHTKVILNIILYFIGVIYICKKLHQHILEYNFIYDDNTIIYILTIISFLILIYLSWKKIKDKSIKPE